MNGKYKITAYKKATDNKGNNIEVTWEQFCKSVEKPIVYSITSATPKNVAKEIKTGTPAFIAGEVNGSRGNAHVKTRCFLTLDVECQDKDNPYFSDITTALDIIKKDVIQGHKAVIYTTFSNSLIDPRFRVVIPFSEPVTGSDYKQVAEYYIQQIPNGNLFIDGCSAVVGQLMFTPSVPNKEAESLFYTQVFDGEPYTPVKPSTPSGCHRPTKKQNPKGIDGIVGAFNRAYSVPEAIDTFLGDYYEEGTMPNRYTYTQGSSANGLLILPYKDENGNELYQGAFADIMHDTAPAAHSVQNAYDLVRYTLHPRYTKIELSTDPSVTEKEKKEARAKSEKAFNAEISGDARVQTELAKANQEKIALFKKQDTQQGGTASDDCGWCAKLRINKQGQIKPSLHNAVLIMRNLKDIKITYNEFEAKQEIEGAWAKHRRAWQDNDSSEYSLYITDLLGDSLLEEFKSSVIDEAANTIAHRNEVNPARDYFESLKWDGKQRLNTCLSRYLGAEENEYSDFIFTKHMVAAVARACSVEPYKHDQILILSGDQGLGKSTFIQKLCPSNDWYLPDLAEFGGKTPKELIQGKLFVECAELVAFSKSSKEQFKTFLALPHDEYRAPYDKHPLKHPRRCVFWGTTNDKQFLRDSTGERRNWAVACGIHEPVNDIFGNDLEEEKEQLWAEAVALFKAGFPTTLSHDQAVMCREVQEGFKEDDPLRDQIITFLGKKIPVDVWHKLSIDHRRAWLADPEAAKQNIGGLEGQALDYRKTVTTREVLVECLKCDDRELREKKTNREVTSILGTLEGWETINKRISLDDKVYEGLRAPRYYELKQDN